MVRQLLLPLLGLALLTAETATAQTQLAANSPASAAKTARTTPRAGRTLTARERRQAEAAAKATQSPVVAMATPTQPGWSGWSTDPVALPDDGTLYHPRTNLSVAPGIPLNQISHGVTTDYDGRPLRRPGAASGTTLPTPR